MTPLSDIKNVDLDRLKEDPVLLSVAMELCWRANHAAQRSEYLGSVLPTILAAVGASYMAFVEATGGHWSTLADVGGSRSLPKELLADVLDLEAPGTSGDWAAVPMGRGSSGGQAIVVECGPGPGPGQVVGPIATLTPLLRDGLVVVDARCQDIRRIGRLEAILQIANQWNRTREVEPLLVEMAEAATRLLDADRASIFVWDRRNHTLVGRPALGVEGGELRIPDDRGVVGQVVQSGQPLRVDGRIEPKQIDRDVDQQLGYKTKTLLCVPLRGSSGELFGAFELINKHSGSFTDDDQSALTELAAHAAIALENAQDRRQLTSASRQITEQAAQQVQLIGESAAIEALHSTIKRVAGTDLAVLILGENGTGKEVVAQSIHYLSSRRGMPFVAVNCAAIPDTLAESELFGHEKGAFTDAHEMRQGKFELAAEGTIFLDEIGDLSLSGQAKLLRVLEEKVLVRVGGSTSIHTDARVVAATNQNLAEMVREKRFREDLFFRLNVVTLELPPLRDRVDDILLLAHHFLRDFCVKARRGVLEFSASARNRLESHPWPGNVRELRNLMERLAYMSTEDKIEADDLAFILAPQGGRTLVPDVDRPLTEATADFQAEYIGRAIEQAGRNMSRAAARLGLHRSNLYRKMRQLGIATSDPDGGE